MDHRQQLAIGASLRLFWGADATGTFRAMTYFNALDRRQQLTFDALWERFLATGIIRPHERLDQFDDGLLLFRSSTHRLVGFTERRDVILIDAFSRRDFPGRRPKERLEESRQLRLEHLTLQGATDALPT
ncbi:hypothetical protein [Conexibacter sp. CPCC 206217]|uniref:hypothetical protein n=1 Tax=Conexibacter sp. CPCC 206217 TaxID=3064574 RepID=UPI002721FBB2|nr:hypothetical protein [Conexibacter sp. CPCC 206217]MDO8208982.1 hypothetical protein [Conexibacter sp. CPCC 206217]